MKLALPIALVAICLVLVILLLPFVVNLNRYEARYRPFLEEKLDRKILIGNIRLMIFPRLGIRVEQVTIMDDPAFSTEPFATVRALEVGVKLRSLFSRRIELDEVVMHDPVVTLIKNSKGLINLSTLGRQAPGPPSKGPTQGSALPEVEEVELTGGKIIYSDRAGPQPKEYALDGLRLIMKSLKVGDIAGLHFSAVVQPLNLPVTLDGSFGPLQETAALEDFDFALRTGEAVAYIKGSAVGGLLKLKVRSQVINSEELPVLLPLTKPAKVRDFQLFLETFYPLQEGLPLQNAVTQAKMDLEVDLGKSTVIIAGGGASGNFHLDVSADLIDAADLPIALPLIKPVQIKNLKFQAEAKYPDADGRSFQDTVTVNTLTFDVTTESSTLIVKGSGPSTNFKLAARADSIGSSGLPLPVPLKKPLVLKNLDLALEVHQPHIQISSVTFNLAGGHAQGSGGTTIGITPMPFEGRLTLKDIHLGPLMEVISHSPITMTGTADAQLTFNWTGVSFAALKHSLTASGHLSAKEGTLEGINVLKEVTAVAKGLTLSFDTTNTTAFDKLDATFHNKKALLHVDRFQLRNRLIDASGMGTIGFDQSVDLRTKVTLLGKRITIPVIMQGTLKAPTYSLDTGVIGSGLKKIEEGAVAALIKGGKASEDLIKQSTEGLKHLITPETVDTPSTRQRASR